MSTSICGYQFGGLEQDEEGQRDYTFYFYVMSSDGLDGPAAVLQTEGLPEEGQIYDTTNLRDAAGFVVGFRDQDEWAWCRGNRSITSEQTDDEKVVKWKLKFLFSTKPQRPDKQRCLDNPVTDPLLEPPKITFGHQQEKEGAVLDRFGRAINNSAFEPIRGPQVEFDEDKPTIVIEQNVGTPLQGYILPTMFANCVNQYPLWGLPPRTIKLVPDSGSREYYGTCLVYYKRKLTFAINRKTWDRWVLDEGTKVLAGDWITPTPSSKPFWQLRPATRGPNAAFDPSNFIKYIDPNGTPGRVILNGAGLPAGVVSISTGTGQAYQDAISDVLSALSSISGLQNLLARSVGVLNSADGTVDPNSQQSVWSIAAIQYQDLQTTMQVALRLSTFPTAQITLLQAASTALAGVLTALQVANTNLAQVPANNIPAGLNNAVFAALQPYQTAVIAFTNSSLGTGSGTSGVETGNAGRIFVSKYDEADFLQLGIPATF